MRTRISFAILICLSASQGCQWLAQIDSNRNVEQARLDDDACQDRGYRWPGDAYTECRRQLADARQREQWQELQMSRQQGAPEVGIRPQSPLEPYRPIHEARFRCDDRLDENGVVYVECAEE